MKATVNLLRKQGQLVKAYNLAQQQLTENPNNNRNKSDMLWVYYAFAKQQVELVNHENTWRIMKNICELNIDDNQMFNNNFNWQLVKLINNTKNSNQHQDKLLKVLQACHKMLQKQQASESKSVLIKIIIKHLKNKPQSWQLLNFLDFKHYRKQDFFSEEYQGKKMMPLFEQMLYAFMKNWLLTAQENNSEALEYTSLIKNHLTEISELYNFKFLNYYFAQLLLVSNQKENAYQIAQLFLQKNTTQSWAWELLAKCSEDDKKKLLFLSKALLLQKKPAFSVGIRQAILEVFLKERKYNFAALMAQNIIQIREKEGWSISDYLFQVAQKFERNEDTKREMDNEVIHQANDAVMHAFDDVVIQESVVVGIDKSRNLYFLLSVDGKKYRWKDKYNYDLGDYVQIFSLKDQVIGMNILSNKVLSGEYIKKINGSIKKVKDFGFINNAFVSPALIKQCINIQGSVDAIIIKEQNSKTKKMGWRALKISK